MEYNSHSVFFHLGLSPVNKLVRMVLLLSFSKESFFWSRRPSVQFFVMIEALWKSLGLWS